MVNMTYNLNEILQHATSQGYRSNVVKPLLGILIILLIATGLFAYLGITMLYYITIVMTCLAFLLFLLSYGYCLLKNPDLLRSEKYNLEKTAIEKINLSGDSVTGNRSRISMPDMDYIESINDVNSPQIDRALEE